MNEYDDNEFQTAYDAPTGESTSVIEETAASGRHPVNIGHLVMGVVFLGFAGVWALVESDAIELIDLRWFMPLPWLAAGLAGLAALVLSNRKRVSD